jgi:hypothetical protein
VRNTKTQWYETVKVQLLLLVDAHFRPLSSIPDAHFVYAALHMSTTGDYGVLLTLLVSSFLTRAFLGTTTAKLRSRSSHPRVSFRTNMRWKSTRR